LYGKSGVTSKEKLPNYLHWLLDIRKETCIFILMKQWEQFKSLRRLMPVCYKTRAERPQRGSGYKRPKNKKEFDYDN
jgi:hypothetical protein